MKNKTIPKNRHAPQTNNQGRTKKHKNNKNNKIYNERKQQTEINPRAEEKNHARGGRVLEQPQNPKHSRNENKKKNPQITIGG
jgi:hypothetical protein